ncbi:MAG: exodeoxyribonuclease VII large subunit [Elusimicrobiota bacterium]|jgi:exodeoxyribonuclease VII large subunit|nr:exodeoxyribonuclease VII large subunit [Elusimicrobiota bacterium]
MNAPLPFDKEKVFSVSEISLVIKEMLEGVLAGVSVEGEISNLKTAASGHVYFDLKDGGALISAVMFKGYARGAKLKEGDQVLVRGDLSCYVKSGRYQIIVRSVSVQTQGNLYLEFEKLKAKLSAEGLFDAARKKPLPKFPARIGVITSPTGAAVRDILSVLRRRGRNLEVIIAPVLVQGEGSREQICEAIAALNKLKPAVDVLLLGRGGGSIEDLWSFNEEIVVRAVAASGIPVISCVGHETDFTLTDFAASLRAPTPSAAAELVVENAKNTFTHIAQLNKMLLQAMVLKYEGLAARLQAAARHKILREPRFIFEPREQRLDDLVEGLQKNMALRIKEAQSALQTACHRLSALNPACVLKRGYAIVRRLDDGKIARTALKGEKLTVETAQDLFEVETL